MKIQGTVGSINLEPGAGLSSMRVHVKGEQQPVIVNLPKAIAKQLEASPDDGVTITIEVTPAPVA